MILFDPPELQDKLTHAIKTWIDKLELDCPNDEESILYDLYSNDLDSLLHEDITITTDYSVELDLPRCYETTVISCKEFIELSEEAKGAELYDNQVCKSASRILTRVEATDYESEQFLYHALPEASNEKEEAIRRKIIEARREIQALEKEREKEGLDEDETNRLLGLYWSKRSSANELLSELRKSGERFFTQKFDQDGTAVSCALVKGFSLFGVLVAKAGDYEKHYPPILDTDLFIEIRFDKPISQFIEKNIFEAYLFELNSSLNLSFQISPRAYIDESWWDEQSDGIVPVHRLRPLVLGKGTTELLNLYNRATVSQDIDFQILYFTKAIEYVSQTVVRKQANEAIRNKLLSPRALNPDADFIGELEAVVEGQRNYKKDKEAIRQTIVQCCDATELCRNVPPFLKAFKQISIDSKEQDKIKALETLGRSLYATRNQIAHAKANYTKIGDECPDDQLRDFAECVRIATQQVIHWYQLINEAMRTT